MKRAQHIQAIQNTGARVGEHMNAILGLFKPGAKIAVIVRRPGEPEQDFLLTNDTLDEIIAVCERRKGPDTLHGRT